MREEDVRINFSKNLLLLRKNKGLSQAELAAELNYTDKAISKWENQETIPDIVTLTNIAEYFNISVDELIKSKDVVKDSNRDKKRLLVLLSSLILCFIVTGIIYLVLHLCKVPNDYFAFPFATLSAGIVATVFTSLWYKRIHLLFSISTIIWSVVMEVILFFNFSYYWIVLIIGLLINVAFIPFLRLFKK